MSAAAKLRCAIYTRKSTEEGLDQAFNSLDAQREACAAYIASQVGLGWKLVPDHYDDGGLSGGSMERPALQRLLQDIRDQKVDVVVVYKIDRLTRSLMDFARIVEIFDAQGVSFVSITQQFNTTTSMGRLTLNVLLSFAQFEREVTAERIRDKVAASKKKGMWMGGTVPWGYHVENKRLIVDEAAAVDVRAVFSRYLELGSVPALLDVLKEERRQAAEEAAAVCALGNDAEVAMASTRSGSPPISKGKLYYMLANPTYVGKVRHGAELYAGEHQPIVSDEVFDAAQKRLAEQAPRRKGLTVQRDIHLLNGLLFDDAGDRMSPIHATNHGRRYRYYISSRLKGGAGQDNDGWRLPASEIEAVVCGQLRAILSNQILLADWLERHGKAQQTQSALARATTQVARLDGSPSLGALRSIIRRMSYRIELKPGSIRFLIDHEAVMEWLTASETETSDGQGSRDRVVKSGRRSRGRKGVSKANAPDAYHAIELPMTMKRRGIESRIVIDGPGALVRQPDQPLVDMIARAHVYLEAFTDGEGLNRRQVATMFGVHPEDVSRLLPLAFLSPRIVDAILNGHQPTDLSVRHLARKIELPIAWAEQAQLLGF